MLSAEAQKLRPGEWQTYLSHSQALGVATKGGQVYTITSGGLYRYDPAFGEVSTYSTVNGFSGIAPTAIHHAEAAGLVFIGYANGMIDYFSDPQQVGYFSDINRNTFITQKGISAFASNSNSLFIGMESGLAIYDLGTRLPKADANQFADNPSRLSVTSVALFQGRVWILLENFKCYSAAIEGTNLRDPSVWQEENGRLGLPDQLTISQVAARSSELFALTDTAIWRFDGSAWSELPGWSERWDRLYVTEQAFGASRFNRAKVKHNDGPTYDFFLESRVKDLCVVGPNTFGVATEFLGGIHFDSWNITNTTPEGPASNDCVRVAAANGELYIAPTGYDQAFGPNPSALGIYYLAPDGDWSILDSTSKALPPAVSTGFARVTIDHPNGRAYLGSWGSGILEIEQGQVVASYTCQDGLTVIAPPCNLSNRGNTRVSGLQVDDNGYLWATFDFALDPLMVKTPNGEWIAMNGLRLPSDDHFVDLLVDDFGNKWILNSEAGILLYNDNQTPETTSDDFSLSLRSAVNQGNLPSNDVTSFAKDLDGFVWVGTTQGVTVFYDTYSFTQRRIVDASPPVYQRFPLLKDAVIRAIAVDGGNRKWLATDDGVYLVTPEGDDILMQFDESNSPLLSNTVNDVEVDPVTGVVYFATSRGLIAYQGDATEPSSDCQGLSVFPNPVLPDYSGAITIRGMGPESVVKITTVSGLLVQEIEAEGGTAIWDGLDVRGNRVRAGVYLAMSADRNGESGCIGKVVVLSN